jgi:hypothetical protein
MGSKANTDKSAQDAMYRPCCHVLAASKPAIPASLHSCETDQLSRLSATRACATRLHVIVSCEVFSIRSERKPTENANTRSEEDFELVIVAGIDVELIVLANDCVGAGWCRHGERDDRNNRDRQDTRNSGFWHGDPQIVELQSGAFRM